MNKIHFALVATLMLTSPVLADSETLHDFDSVIADFMNNPNIEPVQLGDTGTDDVGVNADDLPLSYVEGVGEVYCADPECSEVRALLDGIIEAGLAVDYEEASEVIGKAWSDGRALELLSGIDY